jgi:Mn2+/Fe2+ NRAMP family transporter
LLFAGSLIVVLQFAGNLKDIVDFTTVLSFMIAPVIVIINFRLVTGKFLEKNMQPSILMKILSFAGILFLSGYAIYFLIAMF